MSTQQPARLTPIAASHPTARRYLLARRGALPRADLVIAVAGLWAHRRLLELGASVEAFLWCPSGPADRSRGRLSTVVDGLVATATTSYRISARTLARLHPGGDPSGLLSLVRLPTWEPEHVLTSDVRLVLVADGIEYAGNLGTLVRTVDASGAGALVIAKPVARRSHPTVFSASRGTVLSTPVLEFPAAAGARIALEAAGFTIVVADPGVGVDYRTVAYDGRPTAIVVGSEGHGVSEEWREGATHRVAISMRGRADSLNVAAAAAVLLFEAVGRVSATASAARLAPGQPVGPQLSGTTSGPLTGS